MSDVEKIAAGQKSPRERCLTCWEHGSPFDGPCPHCGYNGTVERIESRARKHLEGQSS